MSKITNEQLANRTTVMAVIENPTLSREIYIRKAADAPFTLESVRGWVDSGSYTIKIKVSGVEVEEIILNTNSNSAPIDLGSVYLDSTDDLSFVLHSKTGSPALVHLQFFIIKSTYCAGTN